MDVDNAFIRRAVEASDLAALRMALYMATRDETLAGLGPVAGLSAEDKEQLLEVCTSMIANDLDTIELRQPSDDHLRTMMTMTIDSPMDETDFIVRKEVLAFNDYPFMHMWEDRTAEVPANFGVAIIGAGFNGIAMAIQCKILGIPFDVYERRSEIGGTWNINRYPDVRVDTLSSTYEFSFERQYPWTEYFATGPEVRAYLHHIATKFGVIDHIHFEHDLVEARFEESESRWHLTLSRPEGNVVTAEATAVVSACGLFANPKYPDIEGAEDFNGLIVHPTAWPEGLDLTGKRVGVIGNGSTGVQLLAPVSAEAEQVHVFQRTPQWISPRDKYGANVEPEIRWLIDNVPGYWNWCRFTSIMSLFAFHSNFLAADPEWEAKGGRVTQISEAVGEMLRGYITDQVDGRQDLIDKLIPDYAPMVRRPVVDNNWYKSLTRDNVELVTDAIVRLTPTGVETADSQHRELDVLVTATGFDIVKYLWPAEYYGIDGTNLHERWAADSPRAYAGMMVPEFPNMFILYGPNSQPVSGGVSLPQWYQMWTGFIGKCLTTMIEEGHSRIMVNNEAFTRYNTRLDSEAAKLTMLTDEGSRDVNYYVQGGRMQVNAPWETAEYYSYVSAPKRDDIDFS